MNENTKTCPECAESIQASALVCRHCGFDYRIGGRNLQRSTSGKAIAALVLGLVWVYGIGSILALVFGYQARKEIDSSNGRLEGRGMATAGVVLGWIGVAGLIAFILAIVSAASAASF